MAYTANKLKAQALRKMADFDPGGTTAVVVALNGSGVDGGIALATNTFQAYLLGVMHSVGTGTIDLIEIITADAAAMTGNVTVIASKVGTTADAVGDTIWLEVTGEQVAATKAASNLYIGARVTCGTGTDECVVFFEAGAGRAADDLTADFIA